MVAARGGRAADEPRNSRVNAGRNPTKAVFRCVRINCDRADDQAAGAGRYRVPPVAATRCRCAPTCPSPGATLLVRRSVALDESAGTPRHTHHASGLLGWCHMPPRRPACGPQWRRPAPPTCPALQRRAPRPAAVPSRRHRAPAQVPTISLRGRSVARHPRTHLWCSHHRACSPRRCRRPLGRVGGSQLRRGHLLTAAGCRRGDQQPPGGAALEQIALIGACAACKGERAESSAWSAPRFPGSRHRCRVVHRLQTHCVGGSAPVRASAAAI